MALQLDEESADKEVSDESKEKTKKTAQLTIMKMKREKLMVMNRKAMVMLIVIMMMLV